MEGVRQLINVGTALVTLSGCVGPEPCGKSIEAPQVAVSKGLLNQIEGAIIAGAVGDALGAATENFYSYADFSKADISGPQDITLANYLQRPLLKNPTGKLPTTGPVICGNGDPCLMYTDDTVMSKALLDVFVAWLTQYDQPELSSPAYNELLEETAYGLLASVNKDPYSIRGAKQPRLSIPFQFDVMFGPRFHGSANISSLDLVNDRLKKGASDWWNLDASGVLSSSNKVKKGGCGSVMRAWPCGIIFQDPAYAAQLADDQSKITHPHPMARAACRALAAGVAVILKGERSIDKIAERMITEARRLRAEVINFRLDMEGLKGANSRELTHMRESLEQRYEYVKAHTRIAQDLLLPDDMIQYAYDAAKHYDTSKHKKATHADVFGEADDRSSSGRGRSKSGKLLGWAADEAVAGAVYLFAKYANQEGGLWKGMQEGAYTPGADSDSIASLAGVLIGAYRGLEIPVGEQSAITKLENYKVLLNLAGDAAQAREAKGGAIK